MIEKLLLEKKAELIDYNIGQCNFCFIECFNFLHKKRLANFFKELGFMIEYGLENISTIEGLSCDKIIIISSQNSLNIFRKYLHSNERKYLDNKILFFIENINGVINIPLKFEGLENLRCFSLSEILKKKETVVDFLYNEFKLNGKFSGS